MHDIMNNSQGSQVKIGTIRASHCYHELSIDNTDPGWWLFPGDSSDRFTERTTLD